MFSRVKRVEQMYEGDVNATEIKLKDKFNTSVVLKRKQIDMEAMRF